MDSLSFGHGAVGRLLVLGLALVFVVPVPIGRAFAAGDAIAPVEDFSRELDKLKKSFGELGKKMEDSAKAIDDYTDVAKARKEIEDLRAAVSGLLDAVTDNGGLSTLGDKALIRARDKLKQLEQVAAHVAGQ
jgi:HAMP domain-containing protein